MQWVSNWEPKTRLTLRHVWLGERVERIPMAHDIIRTNCNTFTPRYMILSALNLSNLKFIMPIKDVSLHLNTLHGRAFLIWNLRRVSVLVRTTTKWKFLKNIAKRALTKDIVSPRLVGPRLYSGISLCVPMVVDHMNPRGLMDDPCTGLPNSPRSHLWDVTTFYATKGLQPTHWWYFFGKLLIGE